MSASFYGVSLKARKIPSLAFGLNGDSLGARLPGEVPESTLSQRVAEPRAPTDFCPAAPCP